MVVKDAHLREAKVATGDEVLQSEQMVKAPCGQLSP